MLLQSTELINAYLTTSYMYFLIFLSIPIFFIIISIFRLQLSSIFIQYLNSKLYSNLISLIFLLFLQFLSTKKIYINTKTRYTYIYQYFIIKFNLTTILLWLTLYIIKYSIYHLTYLSFLNPSKFFSIF